MRWLQSQLLFKIFSSAKLAVPVLLIIAAITSYGTILESRYNADYAKLIVYDSWWFRGLLLILGLTIFLATLSRWPWRRRHIGFLITHLGLLVLLSGSYITYRWGIDGQLQVSEGSAANRVFLKERVLEFSGPRDFKKILIPMHASEKLHAQLASENQQLAGRLKILNYRPFVQEPSSEVQPSFSSGALLSFRLQSQFFDQAAWLHSEQRPEMQMGPALLRLVKSESKAQPETAKKSQSPAEQIIVFDQASAKELTRKTLAQAKAGFKVGDVQIKATRIFRFATVGANKISEGPPGTPNPALELEYRQGGSTYRDVLFAKFPDFSIMKENHTGLRVVYQSADGSSQPTDSAAASSRNVIEFILPQNPGDNVTLHLRKDGKTVLRQPATPGQEIVTPWMGMKISLTKFTADTSAENTESTEPIAVEPEQKHNTLPPSAIRVQLATQPTKTETKPIWLIEGQVREIEINGEAHQLYYGSNTIQLPFMLALNKFHKVDYPGTETPMTFASDVESTGQGTATISMNEPLKRDGYTLYQSSYDLRPDRPPVSIFSVNKDPGRWVKYLGSIILAIGIITYTVMRSRLARKKTQ